MGSVFFFFLYFWSPCIHEQTHKAFLSLKNIVGIYKHEATHCQESLVQEIRFVPMI